MSPIRVQATDVRNDGSGVSLRRAGTTVAGMPDPISLRPGAPHDALPIAALAVQVFLDTYATDGVRPDLAREAFREYSPDAFDARLAHPHRRFVLAEKGAGLAGFAEVVTLPVAAPAGAVTGAELVRLYVQPAFQRAGLGVRLLRAAEAVARDAGMTALWLTAWEGNERARAFYSRHGYADVGETFHVIDGQRYGNRVFALAV